MIQITQINPTKLIGMHLKTPSSRSISKYINKDARGKAIRQKFLDYFINENDHKFVKSSPVMPYCDPTLAFVNAGMNQFKGIFLGTQSAKFSRVANMQKCIRIGGIHNDLNTVGKDGYHHTFFEMMGNWSFDDYFKADSCKMAWDLLTNVYKIPKSRLYVTYFKGDSELGIEEDTETKEIWKEIGVPDNKLLPFGVKDNFWEMGLVGPCGRCTEIHYDHIGTINRKEFVNKGLHDLTEIWNIVFIEYNRHQDGTLSHLSKKHVDTGMGFERLTSILQAKVSNYDTDNFSYLLKAIHKICSDIPKYSGKFGENDWNDQDQSYRILADHARMVTVCLADGIIPEENQKLRRVLRRSFLLSELVFKKKCGLLKELTNYVVENLGSVYPEMEKNILQVHQIINYEEEIYKNIRDSAAKDWASLIKENPNLQELDIIETPNFITAYKEVKGMNIKEIDSKLAFKLYDTHGIDENGIIKIAKSLNLTFNSENLSNELENAKIKSKTIDFNLDMIYANLVKEKIKKTEDIYKYNYIKENNIYQFKDIDVTIFKIFHDGHDIKEIPSDYYCSLLLDKTNLYSEAGGQTYDLGVITFGNDRFDVTSLENLNGYILHKGFFKSQNNTLRVDSVGVLSINEDFRKSCMQNHTCTHLLNATLKKMKGATCQKSSKVTDKFLNFDVAIFGNKLTTKEVEKIEKEIFRLIKKAIPVETNIVNSQQLLEFDQVTLIPGEIYPDVGIRIVEIKEDNFLSREPCCGTHVVNTADIEDFCIVNIKSLGRSTVSISAVTGDRAKLAKSNGADLLDQIGTIKIYVKDNMDKPEMLEMAVATLKKQLCYNVDSDNILPLTVKMSCIEKLDDISVHIKNAVKGNLKQFIEMEMKNVLDSNVKTTKSHQKYIIHYLRSSMMLEDVPLQKATRLCPDIPILIISYADNTVKARCCVPKNIKSDNFNAEIWMNQTVAAVFKSRAAPPKGQDGTLVCNMRPKKVHVQEWDPLLNKSIESAKNFIEDNL